jgi:hypothetical protein
MNSARAFSIQHGHFQFNTGIFNSALAFSIQHWNFQSSTGIFNSARPFSIQHGHFPHVLLLLYSFRGFPCSRLYHAVFQHRINSKKRIHSANVSR